MSEGTEEAPAGVPPELPGEVVDDSTMLSYVRQALGDILDILGGSKKAGEVVQACEAALKRVQALEAESVLPLFPCLFPCPFFNPFVAHF